MASKTEDLIHSAREHAAAAYNALQAEQTEIGRVKREIQDVHETPAASYGELHSKALDSYIESGDIEGIPDMDALARNRSDRLEALRKELDFRTKAAESIARRERELRSTAAREAWQNERRDSVKAKVIEWAELLVKMGTLGDQIREECEEHCNEFMMFGHPDCELVPNLAYTDRLSPKNYSGEAVRYFRQIHLATGWKPRKQDVGDEMFQLITRPA